MFLSKHLSETINFAQVLKTLIIIELIKLLIYF